MRESIESLESILKEESSIHSMLVTIASDMYAAIKDKKIELISQLSGKYDSAITNIEKLEMQRLDICNNIADVLKLPSKTPKLNDIISGIDDPNMKDSLRTLRRNLKQSMNDFSKINYSNEIMIKDRIDDIDAQYKIVVASSKPSKNANYNNSGSVESKKIVGRNIFNTTA